MKIQYRSPNLRAGAFSRVGVIHAHIDGAESPELILSIVKALEARGNPGTLDFVYHSVAGPQRTLEPETYEAHTPVLTGEEAFDFFSSSIIRGREDAVPVLDAITAMLSGTDGAVVEIEQNVGWLDENGWQTLPLAEQVAVIWPGEVRLTPRKSMRYEIHHAIEVPKGERGISLLGLQKLARFCKRHDMMFGGWFMFDDGDKWAYWSNAFTDDPDARELIEREQEILTQFLAGEGVEATVSTLVELVLGIWHAE